MRDQRKNCNTDATNQQAIETSPYLMGENVLPKLKFVNEKNIKLLKENWYIDFIFLGEGVVVYINIMLLRLFIQFPISFPVLFYHGLVDMRVGASFVKLRFIKKTTLAKQT